MNSLKNIWGWIVSAILAGFAFMLYLLSRRGDEINALKTKINLSETLKQSDALEAEINKSKANKEAVSKEIKELDNLLVENEQKREDIKKKVEELTDPHEIADYWNKQ